MNDSKESLKFPALVPVDHPRHCQQYTHVLSRSAEDMITLDEVDNLQMDLETLLAAASSRMRQLFTEIQVLSDMSEGKKDKKKEADAKRMKTQDERPTKKLKTEPSNTKYPNSGSSGGSIGRPKTKGTPSKVQEYEPPEEQQPHQPARVPVNETPSKFWQSVEPFCQPMQHDTIRMLEQMQQSQLDQEEYFKIPELGVHFSQRWALEDMREEQGEGNRANVKKIDKTDDTVHAVLKKATDSIDPDESCPYGSLTQRLISAFVEENIMVPPDSAASMLETGGKGEGLTNGADNVLKPPKPLQVHSHKLESRIKMELIEQGILEPETMESKREDEIFNELENCQQELKAVSKQNRDILQQLLTVAKEEMKKQETRKKIESLNTEVMEHYRRVMAARQKKRTLLKKEKDAAWKSLRDRETLMKLLE